MHNDEWSDEENHENNYQPAVFQLLGFLYTGSHAVDWSSSYGHGLLHFPRRR
jgi:hypothetical protein